MRHRLYLLNDTQHGHGGSRAVMRALRHRLRHHDVIAVHRVGEVAIDAAAYREADAIVVNGEGTIHDAAPAGLFLLDVLRLGQASGKRTLLVNTLFQEWPSPCTTALGPLDLLTVREPRSAAWAVACGGHPRALLDSAADPYVWKGRGTAIASLPPVVKGSTHQASPAAGWLDAIDVPYFGLEHDFADVVATLKSAELYVTGQHHGVYAAGLAGIPFVAVPSNSHKIEGLLEWAGLEFALCTNPRELHDRMCLVRDRRQEFLRFHEFLTQTAVVDETAFDDALNGEVGHPTSVYAPDEVINAEALHRAIAGRPLAMCLHGPSLRDMRYAREKLAGLDVCFGTVNHYHAVDAEILAPIGRHVDVLVLTTRLNSCDQATQAIDFFGRGGGRIAVMRSTVLRDCAGQLEPWRSRIVGVPDVDLPMNGLGHILQLNAVTGASALVTVFGADGISLPPSGWVGLDRVSCPDTPFRHDDYKTHRLPQLLLETTWLDRYAAGLIGAAKTYRTRRARVLIATPDSALHAFERCNVAETIEAIVAETSESRGEPSAIRAMAHAGA